MLALLEKVAIIYSLATLFAIELIYQTIKVLITGTRYFFIALKKRLPNHSSNCYLTLLCL